MAGTNGSVPIAGLPRTHTQAHHSLLQASSRSWVGSYAYTGFQGALQWFSMESKRGERSDGENPCRPHRSDKVRTEHRSVDSGTPTPPVSQSPHPVALYCRKPQPDVGLPAVRKASRCGGGQCSGSVISRTSPLLAQQSVTRCIGAEQRSVHLAVLGV